MSECAHIHTHMAIHHHSTSEYRLYLTIYMLCRKQVIQVQRWTVPSFLLLYSSTGRPRISSVLPTPAAALASAISSRARACNLRLRSCSGDNASCDKQMILVLS